MKLHHRLGFWLLRSVLPGILFDVHAEHQLVMEKVNAHKGISKWAKKEITAHLTYVQLGLQYDLTKFYGVKWITIEKELQP